MSKKLLPLFLLVLVVLTLGLAGCGAEEATEAPPPPPEPTDVPAPVEPTDVPPPPVPEGPGGVTAEDLDGVEIEFWHVYDDEPGDALIALVDEFNATNEYGITVLQYDQGGHTDNVNNMNAAINTGDLPDIATGYINDFMTYDSAAGIIVDLMPYVNDPNFGMTAEEVADFYPGFWETDLAGGKRFGIPAQRSGGFLFWNKTWAEELGFTGPPTTPDEFRDQTCTASEANNTDDDPDNDGTGGWFLHTNASTISSWIWAFGGELEPTADGYDFTTPEVEAAMTFLYNLYADECIWSPESRYPNAEFATRLGLFYTSSIAGVPYQISAFEDAANPDEWFPVPYPGVDGTPVINVYGPSFAVVAATPEEQLASWLFIKFWTTPENQQAWVEASTYYPTRASTVPLLAEFSADNPLWGDTLQYLAYGMVEPRLESWSAVRGAIEETIPLMFVEDFDPAMIPDLLVELDALADEAYEETQ